ncbi:hypothetical protein [Cognatiyoonia sp. IB215182]|uniref:hypothetical protein n=1 Tax=Cognatiyoonia sp. IB215182 TaxID=3097353 RepID=UPI002A1390B1|nr:hypothetical protein [Cognatiyoonia sp. IB215182]MDX8353618.1 hypothetical protein [Cognatiyoonia sp. IB215182]
MILLNRLAGALAFASMAQLVEAQATQTSVMEVPPRFIASAYAAVHDGFDPTEYMDAISRTDFGALRELVAPEDWPIIYDYATFRGQLPIRQRIYRLSAEDPDYIGADPNRIDMLTLFGNPDLALQRWGMVDESSALSVFENSLVKPGRSLLEDDLMEVARGATGNSQDFFVRRDQSNVITAQSRYFIGDRWRESTNDPNYVHFSNAYLAMIDAAAKMVPESATIVELSIRSWGNRTPYLLRVSFPQSVTDPLDAYSQPLTPLFGFAVVDWRTSESDYGATLAINHFDACDEASEFAINLNERWDARPSDSSRRYGYDLTWQEPFQTLEIATGEASYCSTVASTRPESYPLTTESHSRYSPENFVYRAVNKLLFDEFTPRAGKHSLFSLQW